MSSDFLEYSDCFITTNTNWFSFRFPPIHKYQFAEPNSGQNIVFEDKEKGGAVPDMIKVLCKSKFGR